MKNIYLLVLLFSIGACSKDGTARHFIDGPAPVPTPTPEKLPPLTTVACCPPIQASTAMLCDDLLHGAGVHGVPPNLSHYINDGVHFYFPLQDVCDHAMIK